MLGSVSTERDVNVSARQQPNTEAWKLYGTLLIVQVLQKGLPHVFDKIEIVLGNGGVGTIIHVFYHPEMSGTVKSYKEKYTVLDNEKRVKEAEGVEGGYLDLGFTLFRTRVEVIEKEGKEKECTTRVTLEYELKEEDAANTSLVAIEGFAAGLQVGADYLHAHDTSSI